MSITNHYGSAIPGFLLHELHCYIPNRRDIPNRAFGSVDIAATFLAGCSTSVDSSKKIATTHLS
jgi:hypothetical protein